MTLQRARVSHPGLYGHVLLQVGVGIMRESSFRTLNEYREHFGLVPYWNFEDLVGERENQKELIETLREHYGTVGNVEWFVGIFAEKHVEGRPMGELMRTMVANDAFIQALTNPLLLIPIYDRLGTLSEVRKSITTRISTLKGLAGNVLDEGRAHCSFDVIDD